MVSSARLLYSRGEWNRAWLWDIAALLALLNGNIVSQIGSNHVLQPDFTPILYLVGAGLTFGAFLAADLLCARSLPVVEPETTRFRVAVPGGIVLSYFTAIGVVSNVMTIETAADELLLFVLGNAVTLAAMALLIRYYS